MGLELRVELGRRLRLNPRFLLNVLNLLCLHLTQIVCSGQRLFLLHQVSGESSELGIEPMAVFVVVAETVVEGTVLYREGSQGSPAGALVESGPGPIAVVVLL